MYIGGGGIHLKTAKCSKLREIDLAGRVIMLKVGEMSWSEKNCFTREQEFGFFGLISHNKPHSNFFFFISLSVYNIYIYIVYIYYI